MMITEEVISFALTFVTYSNATADSDIIIDRLIETDFTRGRKILIQFDSPIILS